MVRQVLLPDGSRRKATSSENSQFDSWNATRVDGGLPPWVPMGDRHRVQNVGGDDFQRQTRDIREWADEYCASKKYLKEFIFKKVIHPS